MELEELKNAWVSLDGRLKKTEKLKESIILEMAKSKAGEKVNRFITWEMFQVIFILLMLPLCIYFFNLYGGKYWTRDVGLLFSAALCFIYPFWGVYKTHGLMKINLTKNVSNNILCMNRYNIQLKHEKKIGYFFLMPVFVILVTLHYATIKASLPLWTTMVCIFSVCGLIVYWSYKIYDKNIDTILQSLDEIKELEEE